MTAPVVEDLDLNAPAPWWVIPALDRIHERLLEHGDVFDLAALAECNDRELIELARREVARG